jgi:DNA polymerase elongation subunit (family B)
MDGWLFDVTVERNVATLWIKLKDGDILKLTDKYQPCFYILTRNEQTGAELFHVLSQQSRTRVEWQRKLTDIFDADRHEMPCVYLESTYYYNTLVRRLQTDPRVAQLFNTELSHIQQYLFTRLKVEPTSKVQVEYDNERLISITKIDELDVSPPFTVLYFEVVSALSLDSHDVNDPIRQISARYEEEPEITFEGSEETILQDFCKYVADNDPDILISTEQRYQNIVLQHLFARIDEVGLNIQLGRGDTNNSNHIDGRIYLDSVDSIIGLIEKARFACLPLGLAARCKISRIIDSRNCYDLINRGFVISRSDRQESIRTVEEIFAKDKGGMIFSPRVGLHENVAVLDYENEYANLILKHNLSYERCSNTKGLLPTVLESVLKRRIIFKDLQKSFPINTREWHSCEQRGIQEYPRSSLRHHRIILE